MDATQTNRVFKQIVDNKENIPEHVDISEDSGFASIAHMETESFIKDDFDPASLGEDVKFRSIDTSSAEVIETGTKRKVRPADEKKKLANEKYREDVREQTYKRLMHLLTKSQFYSKYIVEKIDSVDTKVVSNRSRKSKKTTKETGNQENEEPDKNSKTRKGKEKYDIKKTVFIDMKKKLDKKNNKMNLSQEEIEAELSSQSDSEDTSKDDTVEVSKYFNGDLRDYQKAGLRWLKVLYENGVNGILGDEMGLGKTVQVIALYCHLLEKRQDGPYLIIAPLSTIPNWLSEFERFAPKMPVVLLHGKPADRAAAVKKIHRKHLIADGYSTYPIAITTYEVPLMEKSLMKKFNWRYIVIDEGHRIKNHECQLIKLLKTCKSMNRLLLTGTPLQNNLAELWSLLNFLLPEIFDDLAVFESWFDAKELQEGEGTRKVLKQEQEKQVISTLREILKPFMLRRVKTDVCIDIPPKKEMVVYAPLTELQHDLYQAVLKRDLETLSKVKEESLIIDSGPTRPKRKCVTRKTTDALVAERERSYSENARSFGDLDDSNWDWRGNQTISGNKDEAVTQWAQYTNINERNMDFFIRLPFGNRGPMYRQIVNHPFLLHCPLDSSGLPEISENLVKTSGKLLVLDAMLKKLKARGHKVLLFSTSTMLLDLIADYLTLRPWKFVMLDGRHDIAVRQKNIKEFNEDPEYFLFLISTRAGGVGLNLASADTVIIYDSDWNPQADLQAMARCHRIGQTRPVVVYRLCTKGTIDERIIARAEAKRKLEKMVISKKSDLDFQNANTLQALQELLESTEHVVVQAEKEVYTDAELDKILDRSDLK